MVGFISYVKKNIKQSITGRLKKTILTATLAIMALE